MRLNDTVCGDYQIPVKSFVTIYRTKVTSMSKDILLKVK